MRLYWKVLREPFYPTVMTARFRESHQTWPSVDNDTLGTPGAMGWIECRGRINRRQPRQLPPCPTHCLVALQFPVETCRTQLISFNVSSKFCALFQIFRKSALFSREIALLPKSNSTPAVNGMTSCFHSGDALLQKSNSTPASCEWYDKLLSFRWYPVTQQPIC